MPLMWSKTKRVLNMIYPHYGSIQALKNAYDTAAVTADDILDSDMIVSTDISNLSSRLRHQTALTDLNTAIPGITAVIAGTMRSDIIWLQSTASGPGAFTDGGVETQWDNPTAGTGYTMPNWEGPSWILPDISTYPDQSYTAPNTQATPRQGVPACASGTDPWDYSEAILTEGGWSFRDERAYPWPVKHPYELLPNDSTKNILGSGGAMMDYSDPVWQVAYGLYVQDAIEHSYLQRGGFMAVFEKPQYSAGTTTGTDPDCAVSGTTRKLLNRWSSFAPNSMTAQCDTPPVGKEWNPTTNSPQLVASCGGTQTIWFDQPSNNAYDWWKDHVTMYTDIKTRIRSIGKAFYIDFDQAGLSTFVYAERILDQWVIDESTTLAIAKEEFWQQYLELAANCDGIIIPPISEAPDAAYQPAIGMNTWYEKLERLGSPVKIAP